jgi:hypothetical protein
MVIAVVRGAWFKVFPHRRPPETGFAPPAFRPAPGADPATAPAVVAAAPESRPTGPWTAMLLGAAAVTVAGYAATVALLDVAGVLDSRVPLWRHVLLALLGVAALIGAATLPGRPLSPARSRGVVLSSAGATWAALSLLDMHVFASTTAHHHHAESGHSVASLGVHGVGFAVLAVGLGHLLSRSTGPSLDGSPRTAPTVRTS